MIAEILGLALAMAATGVAGGLLAGLLGVGGGIVIVPVLFTALGFYGTPEEARMLVAVATSLATIVPTSISSARSHHAKGAVDLPLAKRWAAAVILGSATGVVVASLVSGFVLQAVFAVVALAVAAWMLLAKEGTTLRPGLPSGPKQQALPFGVGLFSSLMGIGGGTLSVPILSAFAYPIHRAVGTASLFGLFIALPATLGFVLTGWGDPLTPPWSLGYVNAVGFALIVPSTVLAAPWGAKLAHRLNKKALRRAFGVFLLITAARFAYSLVA